MKNALLITGCLLAACTAGSPATQPTPQGTVVSDPMSTSSPAPAARSPAATPGGPGAPTAFLGVLSSCTAPATPTMASTEGPFFKAGSPEKASLATAGMEGTRIVLVGLVQTRSCKPVAGAKVDIWQANEKGEYDNTGFTLRGHVRTDANGKYQIETIVPGRYPGRTPHIHVKVEPPGARVLTTQLYLPNESTNAGDGIFRPELTLKIEQRTPLLGTFVFIVDLP